MSWIHRLLRVLFLLVAIPMLAFSVGVLWPEPGLAPPAPSPFAITNVAIVDVRIGTTTAGQTVIVRGNVIESVGAASGADLPPGIRVIDGSNRYLMPALWDMHAHVYAVSPLLDMPLYIAYGVTNVRDMQGCPSVGDPFIACYEDKQRWSREAMQGLRVAPRIIESSSFMANGPGMAARLGNVPAYFDTADAGQAQAFVRHFVGRADTIKVYDRIPRDAYLALSEAARRAGLPLVGHKPHAVSAVEAARHQRSFEHARFVLHDAFAGADALRATAGTPAWKEDRRAMVDRHDPAAAQAIFAAMRDHGTYYVPTHLTRWADAYADRADVREDPALEYLHPLMRMQWLEDIDDVVARDPSPGGRQGHMDFYEKGLELTRQASEAGVKVMVGTDYIVAGLDVHREMEQLVRAGLSARQALAAATVTPAEYAGVSDKYGEISAGRAADMMLLEANPLEDVRNSRRIAAVVFNGTLYDENDLRALRERARSNARSLAVAAKILWRFIKTPVNY